MGLGVCSREECQDDPGCLRLLWVVLAAVFTGLKPQRVVDSEVDLRMAYIFK